MLSNLEQAKLVQQIVEKAIDNGKIKIQQPNVVKDVENPISKTEIVPYYGSVFVLNLMTSFMFVTNILKITDINWLWVFFPALVPYLIIYSYLVIKSKKNKNHGKSKND